MSTTKFSDVYEYGLNEVDDVRLDRLKSVNPALYLNGLWAYLKNGIALFTDPKGIQDKLYDYTEPVLNELSYSGDGTTVTYTAPSGVDCISISDSKGNTLAVIIPSVSNRSVGTETYSSTYDSEAGTITFDTAPTSDAVFNVDTYTDGYFHTQLNIYEMEILGIAFRYCWFSHLSNTFLRHTPKIKDKNFNMDSSWGVEQADTARLKAMKVELNDAMASYERYLAFKAVVPEQRQLMNTGVANIINRLANS